MSPFTQRAARRAGDAFLSATNPFFNGLRKLGMFKKGRIGATAIEYGLIAAGISVAIIAVVDMLSKSGGH